MPRPKFPPRRALRLALRLTPLLAFLVVLASLGAVPAAAHEIPRAVMVRLFAKPEGRTLHLLVRAPLEAMRDVEFPTRSSPGGAPLLDLARAEPFLRDAARLWIADALRVEENGAALAAPRIVGVRASLPGDGAFARYDLAERGVAGAPLPPGTDLPPAQAMLDVHLAFDIGADSSAFALRSTLAALGVRTTTLVHFLPPHGAERVFTFDGDPGLVALDPGPLQAAGAFLRLGVVHILSGADHLLFLLLLLLPFRDVRSLVALATSFTVAHSITLAASALGVVPSASWFPPLVETLIAASIVYMACENLLAPRLARRWRLTFAFGLVHGFGFSFALRDSLQFAGGHLAIALTAFNVGVELGQLLVIAVTAPAVAWLLRRVPERAGIIVLSAFTAHTAWHWTTERGASLLEHRVTLPAFDAAFAMGALQVGLLLVIVAGAGWLLRGAIARADARWPRRAAVGALAAACALGSLTRPAVAGAQAAKPKPAAKAAVTPASAGTMRSTRAGVYAAEQAVQGREVFIGQCMGCHTAASHTGAAFLTKWRGRALDDLFSYIRDQMPKTAPGSLDESEYVMVTAYILKLNGMPAGPTELSADPSLLRGIRIDGPAVRK